MKKLTILTLVAIALVSTQVMAACSGKKRLTGKNAGSRLSTLMRGKRCKTDGYLCEVDDDCCSGLDCICTVNASCTASNIKCKPCTGGSDILLCESDDLVLEVPCTPDDSDCSFWFVKQDGRHMLTEERTQLASLRRGKRVSRTQHADIQARAARTLETLHGLILFYLG